MVGIKHKQTIKPLPPQAAIDAFRAKGYKLAPSFAWQDKWQEDHAIAFTVAKAMAADILQTLYDSVSTAIEEGKSFQQFQKELQPTLIKAGWWGKQRMIDPQSGEEKQVQLGSPRRLKMIFDTNLRQAHAAGAWARIQRTKKSHPYIMYKALRDKATRPQHRAWDGIILPANHPWWTSHFPKNGWRCRCSVQQLSDRDLKRRGLAVSPDPVITNRIWRNPRTGIEIQVPNGIDPGFAYNPGAAALVGNAARIFADKSISWQPRLAAAATAASGRVLLNAQGEEFRAWLQSQASPQTSPKDKASPKASRTKGEVRVIGVLPMPVLDQLAARGIYPQSGAITIKDDRIPHMIRAGKKAPIPRDVIARLPELLAAPQAVLRDIRDGDLLYVLDLSGPKAQKLVVRLDFTDKGQIPELGRQKFTTNAIRTAGMVNVSNLEDSALYEILFGGL